MVGLHIANIDPKRNTLNKILQSSIIRNGVFIVAGFMFVYYVINIVYNFRLPMNSKFLPKTTFYHYHYIVHYLANFIFIAL